MNLDLQTLKDAWSEFIKGHILNTVIDPVVAFVGTMLGAVKSLRRVTPVKLSPERIQSIQKTNIDLMTVARPIMEDIYQYIERSNTAILLVNSAGYILDMEGDP